MRKQVPATAGEADGDLGEGRRVQRDHGRGAESAREIALTVALQLVGPAALHLQCWALAVQFWMVVLGFTALRWDVFETFWCIEIYFE